MSKRSLGPLEGGAVRLRLLAESDLPLTLAWRNQARVRRWFLDSSVITVPQHAEWFRRYRARDDDFTFIIEDTSAGDRPVGQVALYNIDWTSGTAEYGRLLIGESEARGRGLATDATRLLLRHAREALGLGQIHLVVLKTNVPACRIYEALGFMVYRDDERLQWMHLAT